jgi:hypothetical protein
MHLRFAGYSESVDFASGMRRIDSDHFVPIRVPQTGRTNIGIGFVLRIFANRIGFDRRIGLVN